MKIKKKEQILQAAEDLFNRFGTYKTGVEDIAHAAKVAKGTIYNYFGNKHGIIEEILNEKLEKFEKSLKSNLEQAKDPWNQIKEILNYRLEIIQNSPFLANNFLKEEKKNFSDLFAKLDNQLSKGVTNILEKIPNISYDNNEKNRIIQTLILSLRGLEEFLFSGQIIHKKEEIESTIENLVWTIFRPNQQATMLQ